MPDRIMNAPQLEPYLILYLDAYFRLDSARNHGFGIMKISWFQIEDYAARNEFDEVQTECLHFYIGAMDKMVCDKIDAKQTKARNEANGK